MAPRKMPPRSEKDEKALQEALKKTAQKGARKEAEKSVGNRLRQAYKENA